MRLYPLLAPQNSIDHPDWGSYDADPDHGGFDLPDELSDEMRRFHLHGKRIWETEDERSVRLHANDLERRRDPAALYDAVGSFTDALTKLAAGMQPAQAPGLDLSQMTPAQLAELAEAIAAAQALQPDSEAPAPGEVPQDSAAVPPKAASRAKSKTAPAASPAAAE